MLKAAPAITLLLLSFLTATVPLTAQVQITGSAVQIGGSGGGGSSFSLGYTQQGTGQYFLTTFATAGASVSSGSCGSAGSFNGSVGPPTVLAGGGFTIGNSCDGQFTAANPILPAGITTGQITAIYAVAWKTTTTQGGGPINETSHAVFSGTGGLSGCTPARNGGSGGMGSTPLQFGCQITGTLSSFNTISVLAQGASNFLQAPGSLGYTVGLEIDYTGSPVVQGGNVNLGPGFGWDQATDTLSLLDYALYPLTLSALKGFPAQPTGTVNLIKDGTGPADCVTGGASTKVWCVANGDGTFTAFPFSATTALDANTVNVPQFAAGGGTANAQTVTLSPAVSTLSGGMHVRWVPSNANTGAATLAVNGLTAIAITKCGITALVAGDLTTTAVADVTYDGTQFQLLNPQGTACAGGAPGVTSIDSQTGAFTFGGSGVSHVGNTYTFSGGGGGATLPSVKQYNGSNSSSTATTPFLSSVFSGNTILVVLSSESTVTGGTVADSLGTTFSAIGSGSTGNATNLQMYCGVTSSSGADTVSYSGMGGSFDNLGIYEIENASCTVDASTYGFTASGSVLSPSITTSTANDIFISAAGAFHSNSFFTFNGGIIPLLLPLGGNDAQGSGAKVHPVAGAYTASMSVSTGDNTVYGFVALEP